MKAINLVTIGYGGMGSYHTHTLIPEVDSAIRVILIQRVKKLQQKKTYLCMKAWQRFGKIHRWKRY